MDNSEGPVNGASLSFHQLHPSPDAAVEDGALLSSRSLLLSRACRWERLGARSTPYDNTARLLLVDASQAAHVQRIHVGRCRVKTPALGLHREGAAHPDSRVRRPTRWC